ncbi:MAG: ATP-dependent helicase [Candidatus Omnitrophica bacterium]|nr:ATP-dependent helicase [Candidatus Omnitrophota bacterium]
MNYLKGLNPEQLKVVNLMDGPVLVLAGPGTGKTQLLSVRSANIINNKKARPENILILTFTNSATKTMKERLVKILGSSGYDIEAGTFHSFANSIVLESEEAANYVQEKIQITDIEKVKALEYILDHTDGIDALRPFRAPYIYRAKIEKRLSELKKEGMTPKVFQEYVNTLKPDDIYIEAKHIEKLKALAIIYKLYEEYKNGRNKDLFDERGRYDFDDMILFALQALREEKELKRILQEQYRYIMVDEYQDTNGAQMNLLFELIDKRNSNLCCVGDDDQSIYRFQGASVGNFKVLKDRFPGIKVVSLKDNYRSTKAIIDLSHKIIRHLPDKERIDVKELNSKKDYKKKAIEFYEFTTETEELLFITKKIEEVKSIIEKARELSPEDRKTAYNNIAVLVRKRGDILKVVDVLLKAGIPYATDGKEDISSEKRVRQMIDVLNLAHLKNTTDFSDKDAVFYRIVTSDYFGIPLNDVLKFIGYVKQKKKLCREGKNFLEITLFSEFLAGFNIKNEDKMPAREEANALDINKHVKFEDPHAMHCAAWAIKRLIDGAETRPVHDILLRYIDDAGVFRYILKTYANDRILKVRDLRALSSFVNMVKESDLNNPAISLADFIDEIETKKEHGVPLTGNMVTMTQEGVRVFTAHGSKGLEFHTVVIPFCLQNKNWPIKSRGDLIPLPPDIFKIKEKVTDKLHLRELNFYDETRLFYVASTRAKCNLIYTASPKESAISSSYLANMGLLNKGAELQAEEELLLVQSLQQTDKEDPFIGTDTVLKDIVSNLTLNPTSLNNYIVCKRKFLYDNVLMLPSEKKLSLTFGNCVHKALEDTYRYLVEHDKFPDFEFFKKAFGRELDYQGVVKSIRLGCLRQLDTLKWWFEKESKSPVRPVGLEKKLAVMLGDNLIFTGKYDKTELVDEKKKLIRVIDYKTGVPDDHIKKLASKSSDLASDECEGYLRQLVAYKLLFDKDKDQNRGFKVSEGVLVFIEPAKSSVKKYGLEKGQFTNRTVGVTDDMVMELEKIIKETWRNIQKLIFTKLPQREEAKCRNCDFDKICWG